MPIRFPRITALDELVTSIPAIEWSANTFPWPRTAPPTTTPEVVSMSSPSCCPPTTAVPAAFDADEVADDEVSGPGLR